MIFVLTEESTDFLLNGETLFGLLVEYGGNLRSHGSCWESMAHSTLFYDTSRFSSVHPSQIQNCQNSVAQDKKLIVIFSVFV